MPSIGDLLFALGEWLKTTPLPGFALWVGKTPLSAAVDTNYWIAATLQTTHILAVAGSFVSVLMINLKIFHLAGRSLTMTQMLARFGPWVWWGLVVLLATGFLLIMGEPARELLNPCFWTKMVLVLIGIAVALWFQGSVRRNAARWELSSHGTLAVRAGAVGVILLWCVIMVLGRWIAYAPA
jgi:hypothetical protein